MTSITQALSAALLKRQPLLSELHQQGTDCYRLFHGSQEGASGLTIDRYGPQLLIQSFHQSLAAADVQALSEQCDTALNENLMLIICLLRIDAILYLTTM